MTLNAKILGGNKVSPVKGKEGARYKDRNIKPVNQRGPHQYVGKIHKLGSIDKIIEGKK